MPTSFVDSPFGTLEVEHPEGASADQILNYAKQNYSGGTQYPEKNILEKLGQTWPARMAKDVYSSATLPGDVYQGNTQVDPSDPEFIHRVTGLAGLASPVAPRVASEIVHGGAPTVEQLGEHADDLYKSVRESGVEYAPKSVSNMADALAQKLETEGRNATRAPQTHGIVSDLASPPEGAVSAGIGGIDTARQALGHVASDHTYSATDRAAAQVAKRHLDDYLGSVPASDVLAGDATQAAKSLREAQRTYAAKMRSEQVTGAQDIAEGNAAAANSGRNIDNAYRQRFNAIIKSPNQSYGFSPDELSRMEGIRDGTLAGNTMRTVGNLMGGGGGLGAAMTAGVGALYNPLLAATPIVGALLKKGADYSTLRQIRGLDEATRMRSPLGEEVAASGAMTPAEQARQSALIKALMLGGNQAANPNPSTEEARFLSLVLQGKGT